MAYFGKNKTKVSEKEDTTPYTTYWIHTLDRLEATKNIPGRDYIKIVSIDPATKTFAIRIETRDVNRSMRPIYFCLWDVRDKVTKEENEPTRVYSNLTNKLDEIKEYFIDADIIIIERQPPINYRSTRIMQHTISYFSIILKDSIRYPIIYDVRPQLKGKILGAPPRISQPELKKWSVEKALEILNIAGDNWSAMDVIGKMGKKDDLADTVCQIEALLIYWKHPLAIYVL